MNKLIKNIIKYQESKEEYLFNNIIKDINYIIKKHLNKVSLNTIVEENIELIDLVKDNQKLFANINVLEDILKKEEIDFISSFIEGGRILTQKEVASKLGISQQLVSYRFNKIKKKLINKKNF